MGSRPKTGATEETVVVKKYANRRLYNTETSSYITLEHLSAMTREGRDFKVVDARTGEDITRSVLTQIIMEEETRGATLLPVNFLRQLIALYGDQMQAMVPMYLEASMEAFRRNQEQFRAALANMVAGGTSPFEAMTRQNLAMMEAASRLWRSAGPLPRMPGAGPAAEPQLAPAPEAAELAELKQQVADLKARLDRLLEREEKPA